MWLRWYLFRGFLFLDRRFDLLLGFYNLGLVFLSIQMAFDFVLELGHSLRISLNDVQIEKCIAAHVEQLRHLGLEVADIPLQFDDSLEALPTGEHRLQVLCNRLVEGSAREPHLVLRKPGARPLRRPQE